MKLLILSQTSTVAPLKFGNGYVISSHTLRWVNHLSTSLCHSVSDKATNYNSPGGSPGNIMTSSNGNMSALLALCAGNSPVIGEFPSQRPVTRSFDVFFDLWLNKRWNKKWQGWWFETLLCPLWRHRNEEPAMRSFDVSFVVVPNKLLKKR